MNKQCEQSATNNTVVTHSQRKKTVPSDSALTLDQANGKRNAKSIVHAYTLHARSERATTQKQEQNPETDGASAPIA